MSPGSKSTKIRNLVIIVAVIALSLSSAAYFTRTGPSLFHSSPDSFDSTFTWNFSFSISVNYSGPWGLVYWGQNGTATQTNARGILNGSGNYETTVTLYGVGHIERTLCAEATKLGPQSNSTLTLTVVNRSNSTTTSNPSAEVCVTTAP